MKILHVIDNMSMGGAQSLLVEMLPVQKQMGNEVLVLELKASEDRTLANKLQKSGIEVRALAAIRTERNVKNIFELIPYIKQYEIVHVHLFPANYWVAFAKILSFSNTPIITTEHSTNNKRRKILIFKYIDKFIYSQYEEVVACADKALETFNNRYKGLKCISIPNGVDIAKYLEAEPYTKQELLGIGEDTFVTTMVARFYYPKRQDTLIEAIALLPKRHHAVFVGGGATDENLQEKMTLADKMCVSDRVHFLYIRSDVPRILKSSDAVLMSSEYEGLSLSSIEGMACGRPFIATNVNGLREVVGGAGVLFECGNAMELADILQRLDSNKEYYNAITNSCLKRASEYDIRKVAEKYQQEYMKIAKK